MGPECNLSSPRGIPWSNASDLLLYTCHCPYVDHRLPCPTKRETYQEKTRMKGGMYYLYWRWMKRRGMNLEWDWMGWDGMGRGLLGRSNRRMVFHVLEWFVICDWWSVIGDDWDTPTETRKQNEREEILVSMIIRGYPLSHESLFSILTCSGAYIVYQAVLREGIFAALYREVALFVYGEHLHSELPSWQPIFNRLMSSGRLMSTALYRPHSCDT